jgi:hypothetical protein
LGERTADRFHVRAGMIANVDARRGMRDEIGDAVSFREVKDQRRNQFRLRLVAAENR